MELGITGPEFAFFLICSLFFCLFIILPSDAAHSAGFTIPKIFGNFIGEERFNFVEYHLRRTLLTIVVHLSLPFFCFVGLKFSVDKTIFTVVPQNAIQWLALFSILVSTASFYVLFLYFNKWERHYIVKQLRRLCANKQDWHNLASEINMEVRAPMLYSITNKDCSRVLVTAKWLLKITNYNVNFARIANSQFLVVRSSPIQQALNEFDRQNGAQDNCLIDLRVQSTNREFQPFYIRLRNQQELDNLRNQIGRPIEVLDSLVLPQPIHEKFVDAFLIELQRNPRHYYPKKEELEPCLGCSQTISQVKLSKNCVESVAFQHGEGSSQEYCRKCDCRPMWCARCMGRIFVSKQNQQTPEIWMEGKGTCPTCRSIFCVLDVCYLEE